MLYFSLFLLITNNVCLFLSSEDTSSEEEIVSWSRRFDLEIRKNDEIEKWANVSDIASDFAFIAKI